MPACSESCGRSGERFETTHWSVVLAAGREADAGDTALAALARLCETYWAPLYGFIRGRSYSVHDAQDLTQEFFGYLIEHRIHTRTDRTKGKFRAFLLAAVKNFLSHAHERECALKRGGACELLPLHEEHAVAAETSFQHSAASDVRSTEDEVFERQWAETLVETALGCLAAEFEVEGKGLLFKALEVFVRGSADPLPSYDELAAHLEMPPATLRSHVTRLRARYRVLVRAELRRTVEREETVDEELRELLRILTTR